MVYKRLENKIFWCASDRAKPMLASPAVTLTKVPGATIETSEWEDCYEVKGAIPESFESFFGRWAKDSKRIYHMHRPIPGADQSSFKALNRLFAKDKNQVYFSTRVAKAVVDPASFEVLGEETDLTGEAHEQTCAYARDRLHVYFHHRTIGVPKILKGADPKSFQILRYGYSKDRRFAWYESTRVPKTNADDLEIIQPLYAKTSTYVFYATRILEGAKPSAFQCLGNYWGKDDQNVFYQSRRLTSVDLASFSVISDEEGSSSYAKDKNSVYFMSQVLAGADPASFKILASGYSKDLNQVYYGNDLLIGALAKSFETYALPQKSNVIGPDGAHRFYDAEDEERYYSWGKPFAKK